MSSTMLPIRPKSSPRNGRAVFAALFISVFLPVSIASAQTSPKPPDEIAEINKEFQFLGPDDSVLIHEEEGTLKGQIDIFVGEDESDDVLSYVLTVGTRSGSHVEFKTAKVHQRYFRFSGEVQRGSGNKEQDEDYLRLVGNVETVTVDGATGKETTETKHVVLKSLSPEAVDNED